MKTTSPWSDSDPDSDLLVTGLIGMKESLKSNMNAKYLEFLGLIPDLD
jgi:hypothetical protein